MWLFPTAVAPNPGLRGSPGVGVAGRMSSHFIGKNRRLQEARAQPRFLGARNPLCLLRVLHHSPRGCLSEGWLSARQVGSEMSL